jgi:fumarate reductase subunit C
MNKVIDLVTDTGLSERTKKSRMPARLDFVQSATGLFLVLFMWLHMVFVSSILLGKDAMYTVAKFFEGYYIFGRSFPFLVSLVVAFVFFIFILHAALAMRKFPINYRQYKTFRGHMEMLHHNDTNLWFVQVYTGFAMFFLGSVHLYIMLTHPDQIGPYASSDRVVSQWMWPLYILLLLAVEFHGGIGLYRLAVKWGWLEGKNVQETRKKLKRAKWYITIFFLTLGVLTLAAYIKIGIEHRDRVGERYVPISAQEQSSTQATGMISADIAPAAVIKTRC